MKMKKIKAKDVKLDHISRVNKVLCIPEDEKAMSNYGYAFYYNQLFVHDLDLCDVDRYANLNTILGYDVGITRFKALDYRLYDIGHDLIEFVGSNEDRAVLHKVIKKGKLKEIDCSKWRDFTNHHYTYSYFESGVEYK
jgi:hypothetical protein